MKKFSFYLVLLACLALVIVFPMNVKADGETSVSVNHANQFQTAVESDSITSIILDADLDLSDLGVMDLSNCTVDLNNHVITGTHFTFIFEGHDFILKNGEIASKDESSYPLYIGDEGENNTNIVIDNIKIPGGGINIYNAEVTLKNMDVTGGSKYYTIWCDENAQVTVASGSYKATTGAALLGTAEGDAGTTLTLAGGNYVTNGRAFFLAGERSQPVITGGTYSCDVSTFLSNTYHCVQSGSSYVVAPVATGINLSAKTVKIEKGKSNTLTATLTPTNSLDAVTWKSSNENIATVDKNGKITAKAVGNAKITATVNNQTSGCDVTVYENKTEAPIINPGTPTKEVQIGAPTDTIEAVTKQINNMIDEIIGGKDSSVKVSEEAAKKIKEAAEAGEPVTAEIKAKVLSEAAITKSEKQAIQEQLDNLQDKTPVVVSYLDLGIMLKANETELGNVTELAKPITITVVLPKGVDPTGKAFYVVRIHEGVAKLIPATLNSDGTISFETDCFSTYALAYASISGNSKTGNNDNTGNTDSNEDAPKTGDNSSMTLFIMAFSMAVLALGTSVAVVKRRS